MWDIASVLGEEIETDPGGTKHLFILAMFFSASHDMKSVIGVAMGNDLGGTKYNFGLVMFVGAYHDIKCFIRVAISTDSSGKKIILVLRCLLVHHMVSNMSSGR